jgi:hypothetical protein
MPRGGNNRMPVEGKRRYCELIRSGSSGSDASQRGGVSLSCGSVWFIDAGRVEFTDVPINPRLLSQDDRIEIADGLARGGPVKAIAARIVNSYREITRNSKPDGRYQPWYGRGQAHLRRSRPRARGCSRPTPRSPGLSPGGWSGRGCRVRSAGGCVGAIRASRTGTYALRRSTRRFTGTCYRDLIVPVSPRLLRTARTSACCASTCPKAVTSTVTPATNSTALLLNSTTGPGYASPTAHQPSSGIDRTCQPLRFGQTPRNHGVYAAVFIGERATGCVNDRSGRRVGIRPSK